MIARALMVASAGIVFALGMAHLILTYVGPKLLPRDPELRARMEAVSPVISRRLTIWSAWIGFNVSHSMGAMLFGLVYGYLAIAESAVLFGSPFLLAVGFTVLATYVALAKRYWFMSPLLGSTAATLCYAASVVASMR